MQGLNFKGEKARKIAATVKRLKRDKAALAKLFDNKPKKDVADEA